jgi:hypothetical protein
VSQAGVVDATPDRRRAPIDHRHGVWPGRSGRFEVRAVCRRAETSARRRHIAAGPGTVSPATLSSRCTTSGIRRRPSPTRSPSPIRSVRMSDSQEREPFRSLAGNQASFGTRRGAIRLAMVRLG